MELFIGTPSYDKSVTLDYNRSLIQAAVLLTQAGVGLTHHVIAGSPFLGKTRNEIVDAFLKSSADQLLFVDADVGFDATVLPRFLQYEAEIVGGLVPKRDTENEACYHDNALTGRMKDGLFESLELPTAFMRLKRSAFSKVPMPYFRMEAHPEAFGEDIYFNRKWVGAGGKFWIDSDIAFSHRGSRAWRGNYYEHCVSTGKLQKAAA